MCTVVIGSLLLARHGERNVGITNKVPDKCEVRLYAIGVLRNKLGMWNVISTSSSESFRDVTSRVTIIPLPSTAGTDVVIHVPGRRNAREKRWLPITRSTFRSSLSPALRSLVMAFDAVCRVMIIAALGSASNNNIL